MAKIKQHRPSYVTGFENEVKEFSSLEELLNIEFVKSFTFQPNGELNLDFHQFSISKELGTYLLMAEYNKGSNWWVVGYIDDNEITKKLPIWQDKP